MSESEKQLDHVYACLTCKNPAYTAEVTIAAGLYEKVKIQRTTICPFCGRRLSLVPRSSLGKDPDAISPHAKSFNGKHYLLISIPRTWEDAKEFCESVGGHLATITSKEEEAFLRKTFGAGHRFIGLSSDRRGTLFWITGENCAVRKLVYGDPKEWHCGFLHSWNGYGVQAATTRHPFIIEWDPPAPKASTSAKATEHKPESKPLKTAK